MANAKAPKATKSAARTKTKPAAPAPAPAPADANWDEIVALALALNEVLLLDPPIEVGDPDNPELLKHIEKAVSLLEPGDLVDSGEKDEEGNPIPFLDEKHQAVIAKLGFPIKAKAPKAAKAKAAKAKAPKAPKAKVEKGPLGRRVGSMSNTIDVWALDQVDAGKEKLSVSACLKATGATEAKVRTHLRHLVRNDLAEKELTVTK